MLENLKNLWNKASTEGLRLPFLHDPITKKPSITLSFPYIGGIIATISVISLHFFDHLIATVTSLAFWLLSLVMYRFRKLDKMKINISEQSLELEGDDNG